MEHVNILTTPVCIILISCEDERTFHIKTTNRYWKTELALSDLDQYNEKHDRLNINTVLATSVLAYGSEAWVFRKTDTKRLSASGPKYG
jgi:hypothetical protein